MKGKIFSMTFMLITVVATAFGQRRKDITTPVKLDYYLPKIVYDLEVSLLHTTYTPGPYAAYAEKELKCRPGTESWKITGIKVIPRAVPDERACFSVTAMGEYRSIFLNMTPAGILAGVNSNAECGKSESLAHTSVNLSDIDAYETGNIWDVKTFNFMKEIADTNYTYQEIDGKMRKIWDPIIHYEIKKTEEVVAEILMQLYHIRSLRMQLLSNEKTVPDGLYLKGLLESLGRQEEEYLCLFLGKKQETKEVRLITAEVNKENTTIPVFDFSPQRGVLPVGSGSTTYSIAFRKHISGESGKAETNTGVVFYREVADGMLRLMQDGKVVREIPSGLPQLGKLKSFPIDVILNEGLSIEFYPDYGSIKRVYKK